MVDKFASPQNEEEAALIVDRVFKEFVEAPPDSKERRDIWKESEEWSELAVPRLIYYLNDKDDNVRLLAIFSLGFTRDKRAYEPLLVFLLDNAKLAINLRYFLIRSIGMINYNDKRAIDPLLAALKDIDSDIRLVAAQALHSFDDERVIQALREVMVSDVPRVEEAAKISVGYIISNRIRMALRVVLPEQNNNSGKKQHNSSDVV
jgi:HEAT repeat protein